MFITRTRIANAPTGSKTFGGDRVELIWADLYRVNTSTPDGERVHFELDTDVMCGSAAFTHTFKSKRAARQAFDIMTGNVLD